MCIYSTVILSRNRQKRCNLTVTTHTSFNELKSQVEQAHRLNAVIIYSFSCEVSFPFQAQS